MQIKAGAFIHRIFCNVFRDYLVRRDIVHLSSMLTTLTRQTPTLPGCNVYCRYVASCSTGGDFRVQYL
jgi:hypothetical protein